MSKVEEIQKLKTLLDNGALSKDHYNGLVNEIVGDNQKQLSKEKKIPVDVEISKEKYNLLDKNTENKIETDQIIVESVPKTSKNRTKFKLIGGIILIIIGVICSLYDPQNIYYGFVLVGSNFFFKAVVDLISNKKEEDKKIGAKILTYIICGGLSLITTFIFYITVLILVSEYN